MGLTQSAVSRQVRELEEQTGKPLFERLKGRVAMTAAGERLLPEARRLLRLAESTMRHASAGGAGAQVLAVNALPTFAARWLMPRLPDFLSRHPEARVDVTTSREVFDLDERQCDLAIHYGRPVWPGGACSYLCSEIVLPVAGGALRDLPISGPEALLAAPKIHLSQRPRLWGEWFERQGVELTNPNEGHWVDQFSLSIEAVRGGLGFALLPRYLIEKEIAEGELKIVLDVPHSTDMAYYIVTPEGRAAQAAAFRDWLIGQVSFRPLARPRSASEAGAGE